MYSAEVVMHEVDRNRRDMILNLLGKCVRKPRETAHPHPHRKILSFNVASADVRRIRVSTDDFHISADAARWRIAPHLFIRWCSVNLLQLRVVHIHSERALDSLKVSLVTVCRYLHATLDAASAILHELFCPSRIPSANEVRDAEFRIGVYCRPRPSITPSFGFLFGTNVLCLCTNKTPHLVTLNASDADFSDVSIVEGCTR